MKKNVFKFCYWKLLVLVAFFFVTSCKTFSGYNPGTSNPVRENYTIVGKVEKEFTSSILFGFISWGDNNLDVLKQLIAESNADDVINVSVEEKVTYYPFYTEKKFLLRGTAIRYK